MVAHPGLGSYLDGVPGGIPKVAVAASRGSMKSFASAITGVRFAAVASTMMPLLLLVGGL